MSTIPHDQFAGNPPARRRNADLVILSFTVNSGVSRHRRYWDLADDLAVLHRELRTREMEAAA